MNDVKNTVTNTGKMIIESKYMRFDAIRRHSRRAISRSRFIVYRLKVDYYFYFFSTSDMPGRSPSILSIGRAFTSKVLRSYCPFDFVAFHTAYDP